jgi:hypothetical protein
MLRQPWESRKTEMKDVTRVVVTLPLFEWIGRVKLTDGQEKTTNLK